jgi:radical SAM superfamily enzyme YgiQ (UPF0313 family)
MDVYFTDNGKIGEVLQKNLGSKVLPIRLVGPGFAMKPEVQFTISRVAKSAAKTKGVEAVTKIIEKNMKTRFHTPNGLHARFIDRELAYLMKKAGFKTIRLSLETVNIKRQIETGGKVTNEELERAVKYLKEAGFLPNEIGVYIMYGLPGQSLEEVKAGVEFLKKLRVRIHLTEFSPIKGTYYWQEFVKTGIISDDLDPILTNNSIFSEIFAGYSKEELKKLKLDVNNFNLLL